MVMCSPKWCLGLTLLCSLSMLGAEDADDTAVAEGEHIGNLAAIVKEVQELIDEERRTASYDDVLMEQVDEVLSEDEDAADMMELFTSGLGMGGGVEDLGMGDVEELAADPGEAARILAFGEEPVSDEAPPPVVDTLAPDASDQSEMDAEAAMSEAAHAALRDKDEL